MKEISSAYEYTPESVPPEWDRTFVKITVPIVIIFMHSVHFDLHLVLCVCIGWLRGLRKNPPTEDVSSLVL